MPIGSDPVTRLKGVGPKKAEQLANLNIQTIEDLLFHYPRGYEDRTQMKTISQLQVDEPACFRATVCSTPRTAHIRKGLDITKVAVADHTAKLNLTFFNQKFTAERLQYGQEYYFYGAVSGDFIGYNMASPAVEDVDAPGVLTRRILPLYPLTAGLSNGVLTKTIAQALEVCGAPKEILPREVLEAYHILPAQQAYRAIHDPKTMEEAAQAKRRLVFEEFFIFSAGLALMRAKRAFQRTEPYRDLNLEPFLDVLPFSPTGAQRRTMEEVARDLSRGHAMNRLIQGDVGSGKTIIAAAAAFLAARNSRQAAFMVPTEILAEQHLVSLHKLLSPLGIRVGLLTGGQSVKIKRETRQALAEGQIDLIIGTHALLSEATEFARLGLVITDEQHRFGVQQRAKLSEKGQNPHILVMSATPIPRTLALLMYGDLDVSVIDELPPGREPIDTFLISESIRGRANGFIRKEVEAGHQCYIVCPAVEESETLSIKSAETWADTLRQTIFPDLRVALLHGQMKSQEKEAVMDAFCQHQYDILVATTVIEVGVDVPNATLMVIEDADRFGLSQLHQLRGRVGRGKAKSYCILFSSNQNTETRQRLKAFCKTNDGFKIAQEDLKLRGPGDFFGTRQHGLPTFRMANLAEDMTTLRQAQAAAARWIEDHGSEDGPQAQALRDRIAKLFSQSEGAMN